MAIAIVALLLLGCHSWCPFPLVMRPQRAAGGKLPQGLGPYSGSAILSPARLDLGSGPRDSCAWKQLKLRCWGRSWQQGVILGLAATPCSCFFWETRCGGWGGLNEKREDRVQVGAVWGGQAWLSPLYPGDAPFFDFYFCSFPSALLAPFPVCLERREEASVNVTRRPSV